MRGTITDAEAYFPMKPALDARQRGWHQGGVNAVMDGVAR